MPAEPTNLNGLWAELVIEELVRNGAGFFCVSPGSRNTPLSLAIARNPRARAVVHFDERGAAFHALGHARATGRPAVFVCTSGTAVANALPAVVEASQSFAPLIVLSADRPPELLDVMANQAIDQVHLFGRYVRWDAVLPCPDPAISPRMVLTTIDQAVSRALRSPAGPVHLNCMFREPLVSPADGSLANGELQEWRRSDAPFTTVVSPVASIPSDALAELAQLLNTAERGVLIVGELNTDAERRAVKALATHLNWPTMPDVTSGLRFGEGGNPFLPYYDQALMSSEVNALLAPTCVLHIGGRVVSKRLQGFVETANPQQYIVLANHPCRHDPGHRVSARYEGDTAQACNDLIERTGSAPSDDRIFTLQSHTHFIDAVLERAFEPTEFSVLPEGSYGYELAASDAGDLTEPAVAWTVSCVAPAESVVFLGASMPVRDMDMYGAAASDPFRVAANRGASGIDGTIATAAGYARALATPVTAVMGDLAALHDLNSLALLRNLDTPFALIVVNNGGGGIFSFLPVAEQSDAFERFFAASHEFTFADAAGMFGLPHKTPRSIAAFRREYRAALRRKGATIIEVHTDREANLRLHRALQAEILGALES